MNEPRKIVIGERAFCLLIVALSLGILYVAYGISGFSSVNSPGAFPIGVGIVCLISAIKVCFETFGAEKPQTNGLGDAFKQFVGQHFPTRTVVFSLLTMAYLFAMQWVSFYIATFVFLVSAIVYLRRARVFGAMAVAALLLLIIYLLFTLAFSVYLP